MLARQKLDRDSEKESVGLESESRSRGGGKDMYASTIGYHSRPLKCFIMMMMVMMIMAMLMMYPHMNLT